jgi:branched-chain amino acid transport system substrate-binding protein
MQRSFNRFIFALIFLFTFSGFAQSADTIKIGVINSTTGQFSDLGVKVNEGLQLYMKLHGNTVAGKRVELLMRDDTGPVPEMTKRLAIELIGRDKVDILTGFISTPGAMATFPVSTEGRKPTILIQAATAGITERSPYMARISYTLAQVAGPLGEWAAKNGIPSVYTVVADYGPGTDAEAAFIKAYTSNGGKIVGTVKAPLASNDYAIYLQRVLDVKPAPAAVFAFVPAGRSGVAFAKTFTDMGLAKAGIKLITTGDIVSEGGLEAIGDSALGIISSFHYSAAHDSPENKAFVKAYMESYGSKSRPDFLVMQAYDTMAAIYAVITQLRGEVDPDKFMTALAGMKMMSPRGPITINAQTRNVDQTIYIRRVERRDGLLQNIEFEKINLSSGNSR